MARAVDLGIADHGECASREQATQIAITLLADAAKPVLAAAGVLLRHEPDPGREVPPRSKGRGVCYASNQSCCQRRPDAGDRIQPLAGRIRSMPGDDTPVELKDLDLQCPQLTAKSSKTSAGHFRKPAVSWIADDLQQLFDTSAPDRGNDPELGKIGADRVDDSRLLADEEMARSMQHQAALLLDRKSVV